MTVVITADLPEAGPPFQVGLELTIYQAAMIYAGRHPAEGFLRGSTVDYYLKFLRAGIPDPPKSRERIRAQRSWNVYCDLMKRIEAGAIVPVRAHYQRSGQIDPVSTVIRLTDVAKLAIERGERPKTLRHIQVEQPQQVEQPRRKVGRKSKKSEYEARYAGGPPPTAEQVAREYGVHLRTARRWRTGR
jgi:hypothetical protein